MLFQMVSHMTKFNARCRKNLTFKLSKKKKTPCSLTKKLPYQVKERENFFLDIHKLNSSSARLVNNKHIFNGLPTNYKFKIDMIKNVLCVRKKLVKIFNTFFWSAILLKKVLNT